MMAFSFFLEYDPGKKNKPQENSGIQDNFSEEK